MEVFGWVSLFVLSFIALLVVAAVASISLVMLGAMASSLRGAWREVTRSRRATWAPLIEALGGTGHTGAAEVVVGGRPMTLRGRMELGVDGSVVEHTEVHVGCGPSPMTLRPRRDKEARGAGELLVADPVFQAAYVATGPADALGLLSAGVRRELLGPGCRVELDGDGLRVEVPGFVEDLIQLRALIDRCSALADALCVDAAALPSALARGVDDPVPAVRRQMLSVLIAFDPEGSGEAARRCLDDDDVQVRVVAAARLDEPDVLLDALLDWTSPELQRDVLQALERSAGMRRELSGATTERLVKLAALSDASLHGPAMRWLARGGGVEALAPLRSLARGAPYLSSRRRDAWAAVDAVLGRVGGERGAVSLVRATGGLAVAPGVPCTAFAGADTSRS